MVDSEISNISIGAIIKNPETLKFVPGHLKNKKMCSHAGKKLLFIIRYVIEQYETQKMCDKLM